LSGAEQSSDERWNGNGGVFVWCGPGREDGAGVRAGCACAAVDSLRWLLYCTVVDAGSRYPWVGMRAGLDGQTGKADVRSGRVCINDELFSL